MSRFKTRKKYRLTFINENTFNAVWSVRLSRVKVWVLSALTVAAIAALILLLTLATPLSSLLPGYLKPAQRAENINNVIKVDSLAEVLALNSAYLSNIASILDGTVEPDSFRRADAPAVDDTLVAASAAERAFVDKWNARERYNLSALAPVAAGGGMAFHAPVGHFAADTLMVRGGVSSLRVVPARGAAVTAVASGTVTDVRFDDLQGYVVTMQHPDNVVSVVGGLSDVSVAAGVKLLSGQSMGRTDGRDLFLIIWLDGTSIDPRSIL
ncbi:MAG: peptidoglycan DD-metalloendopeptidase family protein [Muribaculaceae bacterium]|nr:peptidoglycan DD-metalloendopeptidase family protein [Muribaculaceae bacterium]